MATEENSSNGVKSDPYSPILSPATSETSNFEPCNRYLTFETPHLINAKVLIDSGTILKKCRETYEKVMEKHCNLHGVFCGTASGSFLQSQHLTEALKNAEEESCALLDYLLTIYMLQTKDPATGSIKIQFKSFIDHENVRIQTAHEERQSQFVKAFQESVWKDFVQTLQARYYFLFKAFTGKNEDKHFYNQETMTEFVNDLVKKCSLTCDDLVGLFENSVGYEKVTKFFEAFLQDIKQAGEQLKLKNEKNREAAKNHIRELLITVPFVNVCKNKVEQLINQNPYSYTTSGCIEPLIENEKKAAVLAIEQFVEQVCLEEKDEFRRLTLAQLETTCDLLVKSALNFAKEKQEVHNKLYEDLHTAISECIVHKAKKYGIQEAEYRILQKNLGRSIDDDKEWRKNGTKKIRMDADSTSPSASGQKNDSSSPAKQPQSSSASSRKHRPCDERDKQSSKHYPTEVKRPREMATKPSSSTSSKTSSSSSKTSSSSSSKGVDKTRSNSKSSNDRRDKDKTYHNQPQETKTSVKNTVERK